MIINLYVSNLIYQIIYIYIYIYIPRKYDY